MNCVRCGKVLLRLPAATVPTQGGPVGWGPKCAVIAGLMRPKRRAPVVVARRRRKAGGPVQLDWVDQLCTAA